jgi:hypothetical protein
MSRDNVDETMSRDRCHETLGARERGVRRVPKVGLGLRAVLSSGGSAVIEQDAGLFAAL